MRVFVINEVYDMTGLAELSYLWSGIVAIIGAMRVFYQVSRNEYAAVKGTVFSTVVFSLSFLVLGLIVSIIWKV